MTDSEITTTTFSVKPDIIVAGAYYNGTYKVACYWKNGTKIDLVTNPTSDSEALSIYRSSNDIYIAGYANSIPCYWKNGDIVNLPGTNGGIARSIYVSGVDVYVAGSYNETPDNPNACYWKNGTKYDLLNTGVHGINQTRAYGISLFGSDVYVVGTYDDGPGSRQASYWTGNPPSSINSLTGTLGSTATSLFVAGSDIYVAGFYDEINPHIACYWLNGTKTDLPGSNSAQPSSIYISGTNIYIAGSYNIGDEDAIVPVPGDETACYWVNGIKIDLTDGRTANSILTSDSKVYIAGSTKTNNNACYWVDGTLVELSTNVGGSGASILVIEP